MTDTPTPTPRTLLVRWEALRPGKQLRNSFITAFVVLLAAHIGLVIAFHRITIGRALGYALFEGFLVAGFVTLATQGELARRRDREIITTLAPPDADLEDD